MSVCGIALLQDLRGLFGVTGRNKLGSDEILHHLHTMDERLWPDWKNRGPISPAEGGAAPPLRHLSREVEAGGNDLSGYQESDFGDAFSRYFPRRGPEERGSMTTAAQVTLAKEATGTPRSDENSFEDCSTSTALGAKCAPLHPVNLLRKHWEYAVFAAGLEDFRFHDLRHTYASRLVMAGIDLAVLRELLGHRDFEITLPYAHLAPSRLKACGDGA